MNFWGLDYVEWGSGSGSGSGFIGWEVAYFLVGFGPHPRIDPKATPLKECCSGYVNPRACLLDHGCSLY